MTEELLAQLVEEVSILTAKKWSRDKPRQINRPKWVSGAGSEPAERARNPYSTAIDRIFSLAPRRAGG